MDQINSVLTKNFTIAEKLSSQGNYLDAINYYNKILISYPNLAGVVNNIGLCYENLNDLDNSIRYYKRSSELAPTETVFINNVANIYYKKKDYLNSIKELEKSLHINKFQVEVIIRKTNCLIKLNLRKKVKFFLNEHICNFPKNVTLNILCGRNLIILNEHRVGLEFLKKGTGFIELSKDGIRII